MKQLIMIFSGILFSSTAFASSLVCTGEQLYYYWAGPDGGPHAVPSIVLVVGDQIMIDSGMDRKTEINRGMMEFNDSTIKEIEPPLRKGDFEVTKFDIEGIVSVQDANGDWQEMLRDTVRCKSSRYVGVPIP